jgi:uncharacterized protein (TIGR03067 family)
MNRFALIALIFAVTAARAADPVDNKVKKLQGEWQAVEIEFKGKKADKDDTEVKNFRLVVDGDGIILLDPTGGGRDRKKTFKVDSTKTPAEIDMTSLDGQEKNQTAACIYKLVEDLLTICMPYFTKDPSVRPKEFKAGVDDGLLLLTLKRVKAK